MWLYNVCQPRHTTFYIGSCKKKVKKHHGRHCRLKSLRSTNRRATFSFLPPTERTHENFNLQNMGYTVYFITIETVAGSRQLMRFGK